MRRLHISFLIFLAAATVQGGDTARVIGNRVNLRARPDLRAEVVGQVDRGEQLTVTSITDSWAEILPPDGVEFWIHGDFVEDGVIAPPRLNVRAGPGVNHAVVAQLERDDRVTPTGEFAEWISIEPPEDTRIWIAADFVELERPEPESDPAPRPELDPELDPEPEPDPERAPRPAPEAPPVVERPAPELPSDLDLIPLEGQGEQVDLEGTIRSAGFVFGRPSRYRLTRQRGHSTETLCYIKGNERQLHSLVGREVRIQGRKFWVQGARYPVMIPEQIELRPPSQ